MSDKNIFDKLKEYKEYKEVLIESLSNGIPDNYIIAFKELVNYVIDNKINLFNTNDFIGVFYDDQLPDLILPSIRRVFGKMFIDIPDIFKSDETDLYRQNTLTKEISSKNQRYLLFKLYFNIDHFIDYLIEMVIKCKESLIYFEHIDRTAETLTLIVDNYIAGLIKKVRDCNDIESEIKKQKREQLIKNILDND